MDPLGFRSLRLCFLAMSLFVSVAVTSAREGGGGPPLREKGGVRYTMKESESSIRDHLVYIIWEDPPREMENQREEDPQDNLIS
jgi:hypothetical protein